MIFVFYIQHKSGRDTRSYSHAPCWSNSSMMMLLVLFVAGSKQVRRSHGADVPNPPSGGGFISDGLDMLLTDLSGRKNDYLTGKELL